jgi:hypothetical protein
VLSGRIGHNNLELRAKLIIPIQSQVKRFSDGERRKATLPDLFIATQHDLTEEALLGPTQSPFAFSSNLA